MLLLSMLLAAAPMVATSPQATDNPFAQGAQAKRTPRRRTSATRSAGKSSSSGGSVYYANCAAARAAGAAPVMRGAPGYSRKLDRDNDGVGCE
ncbi:excalibur calcium-binding domain-containing protein [Sphingomonas sp. PAMC26645]|jgi:cytochrome c5|uniref:excalibur calcium-binding domain-containing protein n=1 Tax=Sphingomonas sp. PAMC26645 TaxID=2565555 RepID=UPI001B34CD43